MFCEWWLKKQCSAYRLSPSSKVNVLQIHIPHHQLVLLPYGAPPLSETASVLPCHSPDPPPGHLQPSPLYFSASCNSLPHPSCRELEEWWASEELSNIVSMWVSPVRQSGHHSSLNRTNKEFHSLAWLGSGNTYWQSHLFLANRWGKSEKQCQILFSWAPKFYFLGWTVTAARKLKDTCSMEEKPWQA